VWSTPRAPAALPSGMTRYPLYRRLGGPQGRSGRVRKISPPTGIRSPDPPARRVAIPTELCRERNAYINTGNLSISLRLSVNVTPRKESPLFSLGPFRYHDHIRSLSHGTGRPPHWRSCQIHQSWEPRVTSLITQGNQTTLQILRVQNSL
jgi:hypothetical protein